MHIVRFEAQNVKRLKAVEITSDGSMVVLRGENGAGKSSVLDAIMYALGGKDVQPPQVISEGADHAMVVLELEPEGLVVERTFTATGSYLTVKSRDGVKYPSPQAMLDKLVGKLTFDPLAYSRLPPAEQKRILQQLVGLDFTKLDAERKTLFDERTAVNREVGSLDARVKALPPPAPASDVVDIEDLLAEQELLQQTKNDNDLVRAALEKARDAEKAADEKQKAIDAEIRELERKVSEARRRYEAQLGEATATTQKRIALEKQAVSLNDPDLSNIRDRIRAAQANAGAAERAKQRTQLEKELAEKREESVKLTGKLELIDQAKADRLEAAKFPIEGLSISDAGVTFKGLPFEQASTAEQLRIAVAIWIALNPTFKALLIRDGSLLTPKSFELVASMAAAAGVQPWIEVASTEGMGVLIEDGSVKAVNGVPVEQQSLLSPGAAPTDSKAAKRESAWDRIKRACADKGITDLQRVRSITKGATGKAKPAELDDGDVTNVESMLSSGVYGQGTST